MLINPSVVREALVRRLERLPELRGIEIFKTRDAADVTRLARLAVQDRVERLLVAGGDGTLHHAIQGLRGERCALGIVPAGTGNDLARCLGIDLDPLRAVRLALGGRPRRIDLGRIEDQAFATVVGYGFTAEVNRFVNEEVTRIRGRLAYPYAVLRTLGRFEPPLLRIEHDAGVFEGPAMLAVMANTACFGGGMRIAPAARLDDGRLQLVIVERVSPLRLIAVFPRVYRGRHVGHPAVRVWSVSRATFRSDRPLSFYGDGERLMPTDGAGIRVDVLPGALNVIA